jgi:hypothetical protein
MRTLRTPTVCLLFSLLLTSGALPQVQPEILTRCKRATALIIVGEGVSGTAFHIGRGLFVTNAHVVDDADAGTKLQLVLDSGETSQRVVGARILRSNPGLDLALLKADDEKIGGKIDLGDPSTLAETMALTAFGYPFGTSLAVGKSDYPNVTVSMGRITSLRKEAGKVKLVQIDTSLNPGNSGGPLVNNDGRVMGVALATIRGAGISFAIPVEDVRQFLYGPSLALRSPRLSQTAPGQTESLVIEVAGDKPEADVAIILALSANITDRRVYKAAEGGGGRYTVAAPLLPVIDPSLISATVEERDATYALPIKDRMIQVGARPVRLSALKEIVLDGVKSVTTTSGNKIVAAINGLADIERPLGSATTKADFSRALKITLSPVDTKVSVVRYEITVKSGGAVVTQQRGFIDQQGVYVDVLETAQAADRPMAEARPERAAITIGGVGYRPTTLQETVTAVFNQPDGGASRYNYKGYVLVNVKGFGIAYTADALNDAFYLFTGPFQQEPKNGHDGGFYQLTFGTHPIPERSLGNNAKNFLVGGLPPYNPNHEYTFILDTRLSSPGRLHFGVSDGGFDGNKGSYVIRITQLAPVR